MLLKYNLGTISLVQIRSDVLQMFCIRTNEIWRLINFMNKKVITLLSTFILSSVLFVNTTFAASHTVKAGETLYSISKKYNTSVSAIKEMNGITSDIINLKQVLKLPENAVSKVSNVKESTSEKTLKMTATAFTASCKGCSGITKTGINLLKNPGAKVIAVDPKIIPLGKKVWVEGYGVAIAGDIGSAIKGNKIDVFVSKKATAYDWGRRTVTVKILN